MNQSFTVNVTGIKLSIGERTVKLDENISIEDARSLAEQYPNSNYVSFVNLKEPSNDDNSRDKIGNPLSENDAQSKPAGYKRKGKVGEISEFA